MLRMLIILLFICSLGLTSARPAEEPTRFALGNVQNNAENITLSKLEETKQINNEFRNSLDTLIIKSDKPQSRRSIPPLPSTTPIILFPPIPRETARLENDTAQAILEKPYLDNVRQVFNSFVTPKPLVDRIRDDEKYGNTGDKFVGLGRAIINGYENFSNFLNLLTAFPSGILKNTSEGLTQTLDAIGARLIGLQ
ncbi:PREDICTED: uncharacterized protein LOC105562202 [Vollenhovia emeryi]|uniref:uncharacterized protein LOC105562202 n=1 Tax=Vollenhovia emeryi TaxID=411798 RepID=UPI0005F367F9|nr:PREDICTED: uncharacterized protein LOC105562202 [Vollenhovia emeryi]